MTAAIDRCGIDEGSVLKQAMIAPDRLSVPAQTMTLGEFRDAVGQGLPALADAVKDFLGVAPDEVACVTSSFHIIYHPMICMALATQGLLANYLVKVTNYSYQHVCAPRYATVPIACNAAMKCLSEGVLYLTTPGGIRFAVNLRVDPYMRTVNLDVHVPANRTEIADRFFTGLTSFMVANNIFRGQKIMPDGSFLNVTHYTWDDLILPEDQKRTIKHNVVDIIEKQALYERNGIAMKRGIMFYGCPGTGKTLTGKVLASQLNGVTFIWVTPNQVREPADVTRIYALARELAPTIVFIEDIDLIARDRSLNGENPILCELLNQLDGVLENRGVVTVVTTNYPEVVEGALQDRPGRFDRSVEFKNPDFETARLMLVAMLDGRILDADQEPVDVEAIAKMCDGLSPSHIREVVNTAVMFAIDSGSLTANDLAIVRQSHLVAACEEVLANKNRRKAPVQQEVNAVSSDDKDIVCRSYETVSSVPVAISPSLQATVALSSC